MSLEVWWALFGVPLLVMTVAWVGLLSGWSAEANRIPITIAIFFPTAATLIGCCALAYVQLGGRVRSGNELMVYGVGFLFSLLGAVWDFVVALEFRWRWVLALGLGVSAWMLFWFGLMMSAGD
jgi:hypothetical protein